MANLLLLPGFGGKYESEEIVGSAVGTIGADTIDVSRCAQFAVQIGAVDTPGSSVVQVQQTFDGTHWANLGSSTAIVAGAVLRFGADAGPYGRIRLEVTDAAEAVHAQFTIVGYEMQRSA